MNSVLGNTFIDAQKQYQNTLGMNSSKLEQDQSPIEKALDKLQKMIETGNDEIRELRERLSPITDQQVPLDCASTESLKAVPQSPIEGRISHMLELAAILQMNLRKMRHELRI